MLIDVEWVITSPMREMIEIIGGGFDPAPTRILEGCYLAPCGNADHFLPAGWEVYPNVVVGDDYINAYGVCDSPEQFMERFGKILETSERRFVVTFTAMRKADQPPDGGWRWHKWGSYVGLREPVAEYLADEPVIDEVYCYHFYEKVR